MDVRGIAQLLLAVAAAVPVVLPGVFVTDRSGLPLLGAVVLALGLAAMILASLDLAGAQGTRWLRWLIVVAASLASGMGLLMLLLTGLPGRSGLVTAVMVGFAAVWVATLVSAIRQRETAWAVVVFLLSPALVGYWVFHRTRADEPVPAHRAGADA